MAGKRRALFVDLDGTVRSTKTGRPHPVKAWDQRIRSGVKEKLAEYRQNGYAIVGVTNQGGVAYGLLTEADVVSINAYLSQKLLPDTFDLILYCPYHANGRVERYRQDAECRKPKPGMAFDARDQLDLDLATSIMVGDMSSDKEFAANAGIGAYHDAGDFFGPDSEPERKPRPASQQPTTKRAAKLTMKRASPATPTAASRGAASLVDQPLTGAR
ncbi:MAG: HAD-IIIA family hydrolase [Chloroflexota bacterium]